MKKNSNKTQDALPKDGVGGRLEALVALTAGILRSIAKDPKSKSVSTAEDRAITALFSVGVPQIEIGKLLGIDTHRVNDICKKLKK